MKILIEVELEDTDSPTYTDRLHDALLRLIAQGLENGDFGEFVFERHWGERYPGWGRETTTKTTVRVSKAPPSVPELIAQAKGP